MLAVLVAVAVAAVAAGPPAGALSPVEGPGAWVDHAYRTILDRYPTPAQNQHRVGQLEAGRSRRAITDELVASREWAERTFDELQDRIPGVSGDPATRDYWWKRIFAGERLTTVASFLYGSPGTYAAAGGNAEGYVAFLYRDILGREPDPAGLAYWSGRIAGGENRTALARAWLLTTEATELRAGVLFLETLYRPPTAAERVDWGGRLRRYDERRIIAALVATSEAYTLSQRYRPAIRLTAGNGHSRQPSISADGRIIAFASTATNLTAGGSPPGEDVFVIDRRTGRVRAITAGDGASNQPEVSADGSTVVFQSAATNLVAGDANGRVDVFQAPTAGGPVERLTAGDRDSTDPSVSGDGTVVVFASAATDLIDDDADGTLPDVYVRTAPPGGPVTIERIEVDSDLTRPRVSADGGTVVFTGRQVVAEMPLPQAELVRLPLGPDPERVALAEGIGTRPTVSADGSRAAYLQYAEVGGRPFSELYLAEVGDDGVTGRTKLAGPYRVDDPRLADDGTALLATFLDEAGHGDRLIRPGQPAGPFPVLYPVGSDLSADGALVVGSRQGQIELHRTT
jgi:hypothetical protein